jgi:hypothetical protein
VQNKKALFQSSLEQDLAQKNRFFCRMCAKGIGWAALFLMARRNRWRRPDEQEQTIVTKRFT